jgi:hypothetical protein
MFQNSFSTSSEGNHVTKCERKAVKTVQLAQNDAFMTSEILPSEQ